MKNEDFKHLIELVLIKSIPALMPYELKHGRLKNLMGKLKKATEWEIYKMSKEVDSSDHGHFMKCLSLPENLVNFSRQHHISITLAFCQKAIEKSNVPFDKEVSETLGLICDYYRRVGDLQIETLIDIPGRTIQQGEAV